MQSVDTAIATSLDIKKYYITLMNQYQDKLRYIETLKLQKESLQNELQNYEYILKKYNFGSVKELSEFIENNTKN